MAAGQLCGAACAASTPDPPHGRALTLNLTLLDSLQCAPDCARDRSKCHFSVQFLRRLPPQNKRKREVLYSQFVAIFVGMSTTRMPVLYLHALCQGTTPISTPETWYQVILNMRGLGEPVLRAATTDGSGNQEIGLCSAQGLLQPMVQPWHKTKTKELSLPKP